MDLFFNKEINLLKRQIASKKGSDPLDTKLAELRSRRYLRINLSIIMASWALVVATIIVSFMQTGSLNTQADLLKKEIEWNKTTYNQLLPTQTASLVLRESDIHIKPGEYGDVITPSITNVGKSVATKIRFKLYDLLFDGLPAANPWNDILMNDIQPDESKNFGILGIAYKSVGMPDLSKYIGSEQVALIFHIEYEDALTKQLQNRLFFFQYTLGTDIVKSLVNSDYKKIYERLKKSATDTNDAWMAQNLPAVE